VKVEVKVHGRDVVAKKTKKRSSLSTKGGKKAFIVGFYGR